MTDTIRIDRVQDGLRVLQIVPPLLCQPRHPTARIPCWRAWVDLLDTTITAPSRALLPAAIDAAVAEAWQRYAERGDLLTASDRRLCALLQARIHATALRDGR